MTYPEYETFCRESVDFLKAQIQRANEAFNLNNLPRYEYDLYRRELWWSEVGAPQIRGRVTVVGSISTKSDTWLWAWANPHFNDIDLGDIVRVRAFGEREDISKLVESKWAADEVDGWEMAAISARLLEAQGVYRAPHETGFLFMLYENLERIPLGDIARYMPLKRDGDRDNAP